jgi:hypothetical protein
MPLRRLPQDIRGQLQQQHRGAGDELQDLVGDTEGDLEDSGLGQGDHELVLRRLRDDAVAARRRFRRSRRHAPHQGGHPRRPQRHQQHQARCGTVLPRACQLGPRR